MPAGRPPKPTATKRATGNPGKRRLPAPEEEPQPPPVPRGGVSRPEWARVWEKRGDASRLWDRLAPVLTDMGLLTPADADALAMLCDAYAEYLDHRRTIASEGATYERVGERGGTSTAAHPAVAMASDAWRRVNVMLGQFGLTPSARAKMAVAPKKDVDPFDAFDGPAIAEGRRAK